MIKHCTVLYLLRFEILESSCKHEWERRGHMVTNTLHGHTLGTVRCWPLFLPGRLHTFILRTIQARQRDTTFILGHYIGQIAHNTKDTECTRSKQQVLP